MVPWQLFPIDSTRAQSGHRALEYPSYVMVSHDDLASFEQRPHRLIFVGVWGLGVFVALSCFCFLFCKCFGIPNSPRILDLDDRQGLIASSAMQ